MKEPVRLDHVMRYPYVVYRCETAYLGIYHNLIFQYTQFEIAFNSGDFIPNPLRFHIRLS